MLNASYHDVIRQRLAVPVHEGPDKTTTLHDAIGRHVHAGDTSCACGWDLKVAPTLRRFDPPTAEELALVRLFDPRRYFLGE